MTSSKPARVPRFAVRVCGVEVVNVTVRLVVGSSGAPSTKSFSRIPSLESFRWTTR